MRFLESSVFLFLAILLLPCCAATTASSRNGEGYLVGGISIQIPPPPGMSEVKDERLLWMESFVPTDGRMVAAFYPVGIAKGLGAGFQQSVSSPHSTVGVMRIAEFEEFSLEQFDVLVDSLETQLPVFAADMAADVATEMKDRLQPYLGQLDLVVRKPVLLGRVFRTENSFASASIISVESSGEVQTMAVGSGLVLVRSRFLLLFYYQPFEDMSSVARLCVGIEEWAKAILNANEAVQDLDQ